MRELVALRRSLDALPGVQVAVAGCESLVLREHAGEIAPAPVLAAVLRSALAEEPPASRDGGAIKPGFDAELDTIRDASQAAREWIASLEANERARSGIRTLKVGFNKVFGYYIEVSHANTAAIPDDYTRKQTLSTAERYVTTELREKEAVVLSAREKMNARELEILRELGERVAGSGPPLRATARAIGAIDALTSLATAAAKSYAGDVAVTVCEYAIQAHGGIGFTWEHPAHLYFKRAKTSQLLLGDSAYHRELLAQRVGV